MLNIKYELVTEKKAKPDWDHLGFGKYFTDHMFIMDYDAGQGWHDARIVPYQNLSLDPACMVFHYAQEMFEGLKAYRTPDGEIQLFRPDQNIDRMNRTNERLCIPQLDKNDVLDALKAIVKTEEDWVPYKEGTSLYIRPFIIATDVQLGVHPSKSYKFMIITCPVGAYYAEGIKPVKIFVEREYVRAVKGGTGFAKVGGNYRGGMRASQDAIRYNCKDVLWLDAAEHKYVEEIGTSNAFFVIGDEVITAPLDSGTILPGITRNSVIQLLNKWGIKVSERKLSIDEIAAASGDGTLKEIFASGTAAVISPIGWLNIKGEDMQVADGKVGPIAQRLYDKLYGIQTGIVADDMGWTYPLGF